MKLSETLEMLQNWGTTENSLHSELTIKKVEEIKRRSKSIALWLKDNSLFLFKVECDKQISYLCTYEIDELYSFIEGIELNEVGYIPKYKIKRITKIDLLLGNI